MEVACVRVQAQARLNVYAGVEAAGMSAITLADTIIASSRSRL